MLRFYARLLGNRSGIDAFPIDAGMCARSYSQRYRTVTSWTINQLADFQCHETAKLHLQENTQKVDKKMGKVWISIYRPVSGLLNFFCSKWSRFSLFHCYGLSMHIRLVIFMTFKSTYWQTPRVRVPFNPGKSFVLENCVCKRDYVYICIYLNTNRRMTSFFSLR